MHGLRQVLRRHTGRKVTTRMYKHKLGTRKYDPQFLYAHDRSVNMNQQLEYEGQIRYFRKQGTDVGIQ